MADSEGGNPWRRYEAEHEPEPPRGGPFANLLLYFFCGVVGAGLGFLAVLFIVVRGMAWPGTEEAEQVLVTLLTTGAAVGAALAIGFVARSLRAKARADRRD